MEDKNLIIGKIKDFEIKVREDLIAFLKYKKALDEIVPECPDVEEKWDGILRSYLGDGVREFQQYPITSLGWMMFIGMAMAWYWDNSWELHSARNDFYELLRDERGYDEMDSAVTEGLLGYSGEEAEKVSALVAECASRVYNLLTHEGIEPGTELAFGCYVAALHELYLAGMTMELNTLGYHMTPFRPDSPLNDFNAN